ncbi:MAG: bifunctional diguanylate cyclase/phosphodiesterase [Deltaproteobacteria bacterium]|nr:bifunctional diguanylate cyclase/phosphodiesterase [Deltaproteobacteria bacterium]
MASGKCIEKAGLESVQEHEGLDEGGRLRLRDAIFQHAEHGLVIADAHWNILDANPAFGRMIERPIPEILGADLRSFRTERQAPAFFEKVEATLREEGRWTGEVWMKADDGRIYPAVVTLSAVREEGAVCFYTADFADITKRKGLEEDLAFAHSYDRLTDLPNRGVFQEQLDDAVHRIAGTDDAVAVLFLGIDDFHLVNEAFGYGLGDRVLRIVGERLSETVRREDLVARLGGDEFVVLLRDVQQRGAAAVVAQKISRAVGEAIQLPGQEIFLSTRIGVGLCPDDETHPEALVRCAAAAMTRAKDEGRPWMFYSVDLEHSRQARLKLGSDLHRALERGELAVHYQPIFDAKTSELVACEALLRWFHPTDGPISPVRFIPVAEATGLIRPIGRWVIDTVASQCARWSAAALPPWKIAVNLSATQLGESDLLDYVAQTFDRHGVAPERFEFEVTESVMVEQVDRAISRLTALKELGCSLAIDDFGTGYSSLSYLKTFPADVVKIDRSFVKDIDREEHGDAIAGAVIALAHGLGMKVVGEGVETEGQRRMLADQGCDRLQGFLFGKPGPAQELG